MGAVQAAELERRREMKSMKALEWLRHNSVLSFYKNKISKIVTYSISILLSCYNSVWTVFYLIDTSLLPNVWSAGCWLRGLALFGSKILLAVWISLWKSGCTYKGKNALQGRLRLAELSTLQMLIKKFCSNAKCTTCTVCADPVNVFTTQESQSHF